MPSCSHSVIGSEDRWLTMDFELSWVFLFGPMKGVQCEVLLVESREDLVQPGGEGVPATFLCSLGIRLQ
ncbi:Ig heavy chain V region 5A [Heterocephalus glaber]|nr:Ig heavy chain V region 5A [Heterocephalus glaber]